MKPTLVHANSSYSLLILFSMGRFHSLILQFCHFHLIATHRYRGLFIAHIWWQHQLYLSAHFEKAGPGNDLNSAAGTHLWKAENAFLSARHLFLAVIWSMSLFCVFLNSEHLGFLLQPLEIWPSSPHLLHSLNLSCLLELLLMCPNSRHFKDLLNDINYCKQQRLAFLPPSTTLESSTEHKPSCDFKISQTCAFMVLTPIDLTSARLKF